MTLTACVRAEMGVDEKWITNAVALGPDVMSSGYVLPSTYLST